MQMVKIQIPERDDRVKSLVEMARRGPVNCLPDNVFVVPEPALELLRSLGGCYRELSRAWTRAWVMPCGPVEGRLG